MSAPFPLVLLVLTLGSTTPVVIVAPSPGGKAVSVTWRSGSAEMQRWQSDESSGVTQLWSIVGPMRSERTRVESAGENRLYATDRLTVKTRVGVPFDVDAWLETSGQRLALPPKDAALLVSTRPTGPRGFSIDDWWPALGVVALSVETDGCDVVPAVCELTTLRIRMHPPDAWTPWLDAALAGKGVLRDHLAGRIAGLKDPKDARVFGAVLSWQMDRQMNRQMDRQMNRQSILVGQVVGQPRLVAVGVDNDVQLEVCVRIARVLSDQVGDLDETGRRRCFHPESPGSINAGAPKKARPRPGTRVLVVADDVVEQQRSAAVVPLTKRGFAMLDAVYPPP